MLTASFAAGPASQPTVQPSPDVPITKPSTIPMADLSNDEFHFHLKYPADWKRLDHPVNNQVISLQTPQAIPADTNFAAVGLRIQSGPRDVPDAQMLKDISGEMVSYTINHGGKKVSVKPAQLGDIAARRIAFDVDASGNSRVICVVAVHQQMEYVFTIAGPANVLQQNTAGIDEMLKSFALTE